MFPVKIEVQCRVCLDQTKSEVTSIFETDLLEGYERCSSLTVKHEDPYSKYLCSACCSLIRSFNEFRRRCIDAQIKCEPVQELNNSPDGSISINVSNNEFQFEEKQSEADFDVDNDPDPLTFRSMPTKENSFTNFTMTSYDIANTLNLNLSPIVKLERLRLTNFIVNNDEIAADASLKSESTITMEESNLSNNVYSDISADASRLKATCTDRIKTPSLEDFDVDSANTDNGSTGVIKTPTLEDIDVDSDHTDNGSTLESMPIDEVAILVVANSNVDTAADDSTLKNIPTVLSEETYQHFEKNKRTKKGKRIKKKENKETKHNEQVETHFSVSDSNTTQKQKSARMNRKGKFKEKMFSGQCDLCKKIFVYRNALISHLRRCTGQKGIIKDTEKELCKLCGICEESFQSTNELNEHLAFHYSANTMECKMCAYKAIDFADLFTHRFSHKQVGSKRRLHCFLCQRVYRNIIRLEYHFRGVHMKKERPGVCKTCKKEIKSYTYYNEHLKTHTRKLLTCDQCPKQVKHDSALYRHKQTHCEENKYMCHLCGFSSKRPSGLSSHISCRHVQYEPIICNHCGKTFKNPQTHRAHMLRAEGGSILCPVCRKSYRTEKEMLKHFKWHTNNKPYVCDVCGSGFKAKWHLKNHTRVHTGEKPYACDICDKRFGIAKSLNYHVLVHSGEKPHMCDICEKKFALKNNLKTHIARHGTLKKVEQAKP